ncbi:RNA recognition motif containing protein [Rhizophagus clarus]|uniref:RNA recognition motif containing protein n=1 Tax=Rhizophagus clarus TaxID=94130 RepID=A0A8H3LDI2_9GLOM|nr:RNA recognition motif containing protein [Rhizophagus clarus]
MSEIEGQKQLPFTENNPHMMTKISQSEQITYNAKPSSRLQQKEISIGEQQEIDITTSIQPTSKNEINSDTIQNVSTFEGVVETPLKLFNPDFSMQNQIEMPLPNSNIDIDNNSLAQASIEQSPEPSVKKEPSLKQELSIEQQTSIESQFSNDKTSPNIGVNYQNNVINSLPYIKMENNNMETDDNFNSKENNDINVKPLRAKASDLFNVSNAHLSSEFSYQDENNNQTKNEGNVNQSEIEQSAQLNINQTNRESRRWRNHRSPNSSQFDNEKSDHKGSLNLRKISDAEFQALPSGSRLFLGNLSTHSTSRKELFDIFSPYGEILQISIKNSFGFVQYDNVESVKKAIEKENGRILHGLKLGLEISYSKPWNHSPVQEEGGFKSGVIHRHKKHWNQRGGHKNAWQSERDSSRGHHGQSFPNRRHNEYERRPNDPKFGRRTSYDSRSGYDYPDHKEFRSQEFREDFKEEHDYRPREERGIRRGSYREQHREERFKHRSKPYKIPSRDFNNERRQSREYPYRSQSHDEPNEEFPLPRRQGNDVPECQIIVLEEVERNFLWQVEKAFREASSTVHILHLSRKLHPQSVIRQMVIEGVHAVVFIEKHLALNGRVNMQIFDQTRSRDNVKYDEYNNIKVEEAVGFLLRARVSQRPIEIRTDNNLFGQQNVQQVPQLPSITGQPVSTNINPISLNNVNFAALANLLGSLQQQQQSAPASVPTQGIQQIPMIPQAGGIQPSQQPNLLSQQQPPNIDVQQLLRQLAPQNSGLQNQNPFMSMPQQIAPNLASPQSHFNTTAMMNQPPNILSQNAISSSGIPLSQHQAPHISPNVSQFSTPISTPSNVTDLMAQFKQYSNQR